MINRNIMGNFMNLIHIGVIRSYEWEIPCMDIPVTVNILSYIKFFRTNRFSK